MKTLSILILSMFVSSLAWAGQVTFDWNNSQNSLFIEVFTDNGKICAQDDPETPEDETESNADCTKRGMLHVLKEKVRVYQQLKLKRDIPNQITEPDVS